MDIEPIDMRDIVARHLLYCQFDAAARCSPFILRKRAAQLCFANGMHMVMIASGAS